MKIERFSKSLRWLKNDIQKEALKEKDEVLEKKLWRWYYRAKDSEYEVDILVLGSDLRDLLKDAVARELFDPELVRLILELVRKQEADKAETPPPPREKQPKSHKQPPPDDDDPQPRQLKLWDKG